jgi:hypothetical protein
MKDQHNAGKRVSASLTQQKTCQPETTQHVSFCEESVRPLYTLSPLSCTYFRKELAEAASEPEKGNGEEEVETETVNFVEIDKLQDFGHYIHVVNPEQLTHCQV